MGSQRVCNQCFDKKELIYNGSIEDDDDYIATEKVNFESAQEDVAMIECGYCYEDVPFESVIQCSEGHLFCKCCLQKYVEQQLLGNGKSALTCLSAEQCLGSFPDSMLQSALPEKILLKYFEAQTRDALKESMSGLTGGDYLVTCHHCSLQLLMPKDSDTIFACPHCSKETCCLCNEPSHIPLKCSEDYDSYDNSDDDDDDDDCGDDKCPWALGYPRAGRLSGDPRVGICF